MKKGRSQEDVNNLFIKFLYEKLIILNIILLVPCLDTHVSRFRLHSVLLTDHTEYFPMDPDDLSTVHTTEEEMHSSVQIHTAYGLETLEC